MINLIPFRIFPILKDVPLYFSLMKVPLSLLISISAMFGFALNRSLFHIYFLLTGVGIFLLSCGGATLNNYQERHIDRLFSRTKNRPLPSGKLPPFRALILSGVLILFGVIILYFIRRGLILPGLGIIAILLYNGVYTPLKHRITLSLTSGALCGMIPPLIGWVAAGGDIFSFKIYIIMTVLGLWQLPHFWLILLDHKKDYQTSHIPNMLKYLPIHMLEKIVFIWILSFSVMLLYIPILYKENLIYTGWGIMMAAFGLIVTASITTFIVSSQRKYRQMFTWLNSTMLLVMALVISDRLIGG